MQYMNSQLSGVRSSFKDHRMNDFYRKSVKEIVSWKNGFFSRLFTIVKLDSISHSSTAIDCVHLLMSRKQMSFARHIDQPSPAHDTTRCRAGGPHF